jgi:hypothetical protein
MKITGILATAAICIFLGTGAFASGNYQSAIVDTSQIAPGAAFVGTWIDVTQLIIDHIYVIQGGSTSKSPALSAKGVNPYEGQQVDGYANHLRNYDPVNLSELATEDTTNLHTFH